jgi:ring-1,2-phenylacetyl-CoA epoxidase subunit PaaD
MEQLWSWLSEVADPEIPMVSVVDLGIVRKVAWLETTSGAECVVTITPTYSGCPATEVIAQTIEQTLRDHGVQQVRLQTRLSPPWTTDWISEAGKRKLKASGIAPPAHQITAVGMSGANCLRRAQPTPTVACPHCDSENTQVTSQFGSTACKALYRCHDCLEPFDYFKCH